jgi:hypothetical protein
VFREIRNVRQRSVVGRRRWFQDTYFDLFVVQDMLGRPQWFQLCYLRDTRRERVLEWGRGRGFMHLKLKDASYAGHRDDGMLLLDGVMPYGEVLERFATSAGGLPPAIAAFVEEKVREYERPSYRFRRPGARTPRWLERLRRA